MKELSKLEHERWKKAKENEGWKFAQKTDRHTKQHASLVDWKDLPAEGQQKVILIIWGIIRLYDEAGYSIIKRLH